MFAQKLVTYFTDLKQAGVPENQAAIHAEKLAEFMENNLATKEDLKLSEQSLRAQVFLVEQRLNSKIDSVEQRLNSKIDSVEQKLEIKIDKVEQKIEAKINHLESKIDRLETMIEHLSDRLDWFFKLMGFFAVLVTLINVILPHFPIMHF